MSGSLSRRRLLELAGLGGVAAVAAGSGAVLFERRDNGDGGGTGVQTVPFYGATQAGIVTPQQNHLRFASYDLTASSATEVRDLLRTWTAAAARYAVGDTTPSDVGGEFAPPDDTGEAGGLRPSRLTLTFGFGPGLFDDRYGLAAKRPAELIDIPSFELDQLDDAESGGDLCVQACADDPQVAFHAIRNLTRTSHGAASLRWVQEGFLSKTTEGTGTPRNLMGFKDGTANLDPSDDGRMRENVWASPNARSAWMTNGTYLVARKIRIRIEQWDRTAIGEQEQFVGRTKDAGAPLGATREHDDVDPKRLDIASHIRLANPRTGEKSERERILRRGYNFAEGIDEIGQMDAGLFFLGYQQDPRRQFVPIQSRLAAGDLLNEYLFHTGSAIFAIPPGVQPGGSIGDTLFA